MRKHSSLQSELTNTDTKVHGASLVAQMVKSLPAMLETQVRYLGWEDPLEEGMQPTPVFLPRESSWIEEPGRLQPMGSQRVGLH